MHGELQIKLHTKKLKRSAVGIISGKDMKTFFLAIERDTVRFWRLPGLSVKARDLPVSSRTEIEDFCARDCLDAVEQGSGFVIEEPSVDAHARLDSGPLARLAAHPNVFDVTFDSCALGH